jgi:ABC-type bacteriocin/lantibiotic exporter with double-glycine peptidase domain
MFTGTLRFNLDPEGAITDERIIDLLTDAKLHDLLAKDPLGLNQNITENG